MTCKICLSDDKVISKREIEYSNGQIDLEKWTECINCGNMLKGNIKTIKKTHHF